MFCVCERGQTIVIVFLLNMYVYHICHSRLIEIRTSIHSLISDMSLGRSSMRRIKNQGEDGSSNFY